MKKITPTILIYPACTLITFEGDRDIKLFMITYDDGDLGDVGGN